jgi:ubiquinone/menaquinone biosynthesis C-methylase UbiE
MIEIAAEKNPDMEFHAAGCEATPFPNDSFDVITVCAAYHHFPDAAAFAREAGRILKPGGLLYVAEMYAPALLKMLINPFVPLFFKDGDARFYSPKDIIRNFRRHGFIDVDVKIGGTLQIVAMQKKPPI